VGIVRAGDWFNRLPVELEITGTRRWMPGMTRHEVVSHFEQVCAGIGRSGDLDFEVELSNDREPFETPADHPLVKAIRDAGEAASGSRPDIVGMALTGDANLYANEGRTSPAYYGPGYETAHSDRERVSLSRVTHCALVYALSAARFCGAAA
jgi:acetylornithine deacetylase/succinyl-diaminopimelate desuccinylase-like protein